MQESTEFLEIEHKFVVSDAFDVENFCSNVMKLSPLKSTNIEVNDHYFFSKSQSHFVLRHRLDKELNQLSMKSRGGDAESRTEINLDLARGVPNQKNALIEFTKNLGFSEQRTLTKKVRVFYFPDCEIVYYQAQCGDRRINCVEIEAKNVNIKTEGLEILAEYEKKLGLDKFKRETRSLFELMFVIS
ncbi:MAG: CYTH domain-containing protein [Oligoflexales bacterium]|nr:CYTH domain-containing protein [Oligoflexales bacterium]